MSQFTKTRNSDSVPIFPDPKRMWFRSNDNRFSPPHLMNLSKTLSTHICIRRKLSPYRQSMRTKFIIDQSLSSNVSSFPSKIAILEGTSLRGGIPEKKRKLNRKFELGSSFKYTELNINYSFNYVCVCSESLYLRNLDFFLPNISMKCFMCRFRGWMTEPPISYS